MSGKQYYDLLGLPESATEKEVKRQFRKLAKQYHPDLNPNPEDQQHFLRLLDAYERILKKEFSEKKKPSPSENPTSQDIHRQRWEQVNRRWREEEEEMNEYYRSLVSGWRLKVKYALSFLSLWALVSLLADEYLPMRTFHDKVIGYNTTSYQSLDRSTVNEVQLAQHGTIFVADCSPSRFMYQPKITLYQTALCRSNKYIKHNVDAGSHKLFEVHFSLCRLKTPIFIFLGLTLMLPFYRRHTAFLVIGSWIGLYISGAILLFVFLFYFRFISLFTFGYWP
jgi:hypothetical protein